MPQAVGLTAEIKQAFEDTEVELVPSKGGAFEVLVDGKLRFSKLERKRFPAYQEIPNLLLE
ncbi:MAG: SelT/SelW/SelH family protein [Planctomycetota bacterium]